MTLSSTTTRAGYTANGVQAAFAYPFRIDDQTHLQVYCDDVLQSTGFAVSGVGSDSGGNVTFSIAPGSGTDVTVIRAVPLTQPTDLPTQGPLDTTAIERRFDQIVMQVQGLRELIDRSLILPPSAGALALALPAPVGSRVLATSPDGSALEWATVSAGDLVSDALAPVVAAPTLAAARSLFPFPRAFIAGLGCSNNAGDAANDIDVAPGMARDAGDSANLVLAAALTKRLDASWAVGTSQGGLDTGSKANSTGYYVWLIRRSDTGVVDALFSTSATAPTMPTAYDGKRLIGFVKTNGSGNIRAFSQVGDLFKYTATILDVSDATITSDTFETAVLSVPARALAMLLAQTTNTTAQTNFRLYAGPGDGSEVAGDDLVRLGTQNAEAMQLGGWAMVLTDASAQIRYAALEAANTQSVFFLTSGFLMLTRSNP